jgi:hypothetical protein
MGKKLLRANKRMLHRRELGKMRMRKWRANQAMAALRAQMMQAGIEVRGVEEPTACDIMNLPAPARKK